MDLTSIYKKQIPDEAKDAKDYAADAKKDPKNKIAVNSIAMDEAKHKKMLQEIVKASVKKSSKSAK